MNDATLLIVDDDQASIALFSRRLSKEFSKIVTAVSGEMALDILRDIEIDVLVTDVNMSGIDGCELVTRAIEAQPMLQAIVMTGYGGNKIALSAMSAGASSYLQKPVNLSELTIAIDQCLEKRDLLRDVQKKQKQLSEYHDHLEELVEKRTRDLTETNHKLQREIEERTSLEISLRKSTEQAENANKVMSEFLANMNHAIRTPMTSAIGLLNIVLDTDLLPKQKEYLDMTRVSTLTVHNLLNDILDYSKIEAGRLNLESITFSPSEVLDSVIDLHHFHAAERAVTLTSSIADDVPSSVIGDPNRLRQVLLNLVSNAIKATQYGKVSIECKHVVEEVENPSSSTQQPVALHFFVKDTGVGVDSDKMKQIVKVFSREAESISPQPGGIGLGLNISSKLVSRMGGHIRVESSSEHGSTFQFTSRFVSSPTRPKIEKVHQNDDPIRILVAEDDQGIQWILYELLEHEGYRVSQATDGIMACQKITEQDFDMILLDLNMPEMNGFEVAQQIRRDEKDTALKSGSHLVIIALTGFTDEYSQQKCQEAGMDGFLTKPFTREQLVSKVGEYIPVREPPQAATLDGDIFDEKIALENVSGDQVILAERIHDFLERVPHCLELLEKAVADGNLLGLEEEVQNVKDLAIKMGAINFADELFSLLMELRKTQVVTDEIAKQIKGLGLEFSLFKKEQIT